MALNTGNSRDVVRRCAGKSCIRHVGAEDFTITLKFVKLSVERAFHVSRGSAGTDRIFIHRENFETVAFKFFADGVRLRFGGCVFRQIFLRHPLVKSGGRVIVQCVHCLIEGGFILQLELYGNVDLLCGCHAA